LGGEKEEGRVRDRAAESGFKVGEEGEGKGPRVGKRDTEGMKQG
jgi:hypothetical protein